MVATGGGQILYNRLQFRNNLSDKVFSVFFERFPYDVMIFLKENYQFYLLNRDIEQLSNKAIEQYSEDSLSGYGDEKFDKGGETLEEQQRGQILSILHKGLKTIGDNHVVIEIGCGNGDVIAYLASKYPKNRFIGVDFSVTVAKKKHHLENLEFINGYAMDLFKRQMLSGTVLFSSSTMVVFNPKEVLRYVELFEKIGISHVFINEPLWGVQRNDYPDGGFSLHMEGACWKHNYSGIFKNYGYEVIIDEKIKYKHPKSNRPDIVINLGYYKK